MYKKTFFLIVVLISTFVRFVSAQINKDLPAIREDKILLGLGFGFDYGGIGANLLFYPVRDFGLFAGGGYALAGYGYNVGVKYRFYKEEKTLHPYITAMYGYNTAIFVSNATSYNKLFYGPSFGAGLDFRSAATKNGYLSLAVLIPVRGQDAFDYINDLKNHHHVEFKNELIPIGLSFGYRFILE